MIDFFLFLSVAFLIIFLLGKLIEKLKIPWIFSALFLGALLAIYNPNPSVVVSPEFSFLAQLGMYFLLFIIGFELDMRRFREQSSFIVKSTFFIILFEAFFGTLLVHFVFGVEWFISVLVALSFATVGEAVLIPILDQFKIVNTKLGQSIIGIGTLDDIIEIIALILVIFTVASNSSVAHLDITVVLISLFGLVGMTFGLTKLKNETSRFKFSGVDSLFLFIVFILFLFLGIGEYAHATSVAALLAGISLKTFIPDKRLEIIEKEIKTLCYGFFAPIFFIWIGSTLDMSYIVSYPLLIIIVVIVSNGSKIMSSLVVGRHTLGTKKSVLLGVGLSVRFSTSIIIVKILLDNGLIGPNLYSVIIASSMIFMFLIPILFSKLLVKWNVVKK